jgi:dolichol-phosphate mannosyltransferase
VTSRVSEAGFGPVSGNGTVKVSIIVPVYNESRSLPQVLQRVVDAPLPDGCTKEIVIVDDGSTDGTSALVNQYRAGGLITVHHSILNFGKGTAVRVGMAIASGDIILIQDGDLEYDPRDYRAIIEPILAGRASVVYGSRFLSAPKGMALPNLIANRILTWTANLLYGVGITDEATAYKAFRADILKPIRLRCRAFEFCPEITAKVSRAGHRIDEVPISYNARGIDEGKKIKARDGFEALWTLLRYRFAPRSSFLRSRSAAPQTAAPTGARLLLALLSLACIGLFLHSAAGRLLIAGAAASALSSNLDLALNALAAHGFLLARYAVQSYLLAALVFLADFLFGFALLDLARSRIPTLPPFLRAAAALALGSGCSATAIFLLGTAHAINRPTLAILTAAMGLGGVAVLYFKHAWRRAFSFWRCTSVFPANRRLVLLCGLAMAPILFLHALDLMMPVVEYDSGMYHMSAARLYRDTGAITYHPGLRFNSQPHLPTLLYLRQWLLSGDDSLIKLQNLEFSLILLLAFLAAAREFRVRDGWLPALALLAASPNFWWTAKIEYLDYGLVAFFAVAAVLLCRELRTGRSLALLAGIMLGFVAASKYFGMALSACTVAGYGVALLAFARVRPGLTVRRLTLASCAVMLLLAPWLLRSWMATGSPIYPYLSVAGQADAQQIARVNAVFGPGHGVAQFVAMGYHIASMVPFRYGDPYSYGPVLLFMEALGVMMLRKRWRDRLSAITAFLLLTTLAFFSFWFIASPVLRYFVPALVLLALLFLAALKRMGLDRGLPALATIALVALAGYSAICASTLRRLELPPPVLYADKTRFLRSALAYYPATESINRVRRPGDRTYLIGTQPARYYVETDSYGDYFSAYSYAWLTAGAPSPQQALDRLRSAGFTYVLLDRNTALAPWPASALEGFGNSVIYRDGQFAALRIR